MPSPHYGSYSIYLEDGEEPDVYLEFHNFEDQKQALEFIRWMQAVLAGTVELALLDPEAVIRH